jgi:hypothetical protein
VALKNINRQNPAIGIGGQECWRDHGRACNWVSLQVNPRFTSIRFAWLERERKAEGGEHPKPLPFLFGRVSVFQTLRCGFVFSPLPENLPLKFISESVEYFRDCRKSPSGAILEDSSTVKSNTYVF